MHPIVWTEQIAYAVPYVSEFSLNEIQTIICFFENIYHFYLSSQI